MKRAKDVIAIEIQALKDLQKNLGVSFKKAVDVVAKCQGRVVVTGLGKTGIVGQKIAATLSSTGTPSVFMHSAEAVHGDLGQITKEDVVIIISYSGETDETTRLVPLVKRIGCPIIGMTGVKKSSLAKYSNIVLDVSVKKEGCPLGLAPMASTTATLAMGDALAACLIDRKKFKQEDFAFYHPGGSLGRKLLLTSGDVMRTGNAMAKVKENVLVKDVLLAITQARCGSACVVNAKGSFVGIFTDGDLRRHLNEGRDILQDVVKKHMTKNPLTVKEDTLAAEALELLQSKQIDELPVLNNKGKLVGLLDIQDVLKTGLV